jgi:hypothetical protein
VGSRVYTHTCYNFFFSKTVLGKYKAFQRRSAIHFSILITTLSNLAITAITRKVWTLSGKWRNSSIAVYCENHTEHTDTVRTSQETYYVSSTETNRLMLFRVTVAVYCENHTEHTDTVRTSQETYYVSTTKPNPVMLFGEKFAVYCENHTEYTDTVRTSQETH